MTTSATRRHLLGLVLVSAVSIAVADKAVAKRKKHKTVKGDDNCDDFDSQQEAQRFFERHDPEDDPYRLDADNDGKACEDLP